MNKFDIEVSLMAEELIPLLLKIVFLLAILFLMIQLLPSLSEIFLLLLLILSTFELCRFALLQILRLAWGVMVKSPLWSEKFLWAMLFLFVLALLAAILLVSLMFISVVLPLAIVMALVDIIVDRWWKNMKKKGKFLKK